MKPIIWFFSLFQSRFYLHVFERKLRSTIIKNFANRKKLIFIEYSVRSAVLSSCFSILLELIFLLFSKSPSIYPNLFQIKFGLSEKHTKFEKIFLMFFMFTK